jgi:hypothetical protein
MYVRSESIANPNGTEQLSNMYQEAALGVLGLLREYLRRRS